MGEQRFWDLVGLLDGVATDGSVARLDAELAGSGQGVAFAERLARLVTGLLGSGAVPGEDAVLAAAVIARGRSHVDAILARGSGGPIDADGYDSADAEALLVAGTEAPPSQAVAARIPGVQLRWHAAAAPYGVRTGYDATDPAWEAMLEVVLADADLGARVRTLLAGPFALRVTVHDVAAPQWISLEDPRCLELVVPSADLLDAEDRADVYGEILGALVIRAEEARSGRPEV